MTATAVAAEGGLRPAEERGRTEIAPRVVERIAEQVVADAEHAGGTARRFLAITLGPDEDDAAPDVTAHVDGAIVTIDMTMSVRYPVPIRQVTRDVRADVMTAVHELTGLDVRHVDISIATLVTSEPARRVR